MRFIQPKKQNLQKVTWALPDKTIAIIKHYAEYTGYTEEEVLAEFLENILNDKSFINHIETRRNNKRILKDLELVADDLQASSDV